METGKNTGSFPVKVDIRISENTALNPTRSSTVPSFHGNITRDQNLVQNLNCFLTEVHQWGERGRSSMETGKKHGKFICQS